MALCLLAVAALFGACSDDDGEPPFTEPPLPAAQSWLFDVVGTAANDVYACGNKGAMFHWNGAAWERVDMQVSDPIVRMWKEDGGSTLYAVGHKGLIWRNAGGAWAPMASGTSKNLYGIGALGGVVHAVGQDGVICRLSGSTWSVTAGRMFQLNEVGAPIDTLLVAEDLASLVTVNHYFLGGAYLDPNFTGTRIGVFGTRGMVLAPNTDGALLAEWILRPLSGEQTVLHEWVLATTSDPAVLSRNYLGTSEGWLFRLTRDDAGRNVWSKFFPTFTSSPGAGINDMWVDAADNVYLVTDEGQIVYQSADYDFAAGTGRRAVLYDGFDRLTGIWGAGPGDIWVVGYRTETIFHVSHDQVTDDVEMTPLTVTFPDKVRTPPGTVDHLGRPLD
ncbi:MAG: hypothetical protein IPK64_07790 [bacterium]|nr:hypothetical protein [bacterium]